MVAPRLDINLPAGGTVPYLAGVHPHLISEKTEASSNNDSEAILLLGLTGEPPGLRYLSGLPVFTGETSRHIMVGRATCGNLQRVIVSW